MGFNAYAEFAVVSFGTVNLHSHITSEAIVILIELYDTNEMFPIGSDPPINEVVSCRGIIPHKHFCADNERYPYGRCLRIQMNNSESARSVNS